MLITFISRLMHSIIQNLEVKIYKFDVILTVHRRMWK